MTQVALKVHVDPVHIPQRIEHIVSVHLGSLSNRSDFHKAWVLGLSQNGDEARGNDSWVLPFQAS